LRGLGEQYIGQIAEVLHENRKSWGAALRLPADFQHVIPAARVADSSQPAGIASLRRLIGK
jgi:hypothetical protein